MIKDITKPEVWPWEKPIIIEGVFAWFPTKIEQNGCYTENHSDIPHNVYFIWFDYYYRKLSYRCVYGNWGYYIDFVWVDWPGKYKSYSVSKC